MKILYTVSLLAIIGFSSCTKEPVKAPVTEPHLESVAFLSRVFNYADPTDKDSVGYTSSRDSVRTTATIKPTGELDLHINMPFSKGRDYVQLIIDKAKLKPGYVGTYELKPTLPGGFQGDAQSIFGYRRDQYSYTEIGPGNAEGAIIITGYDATKKLLAGKYRFSIHSFHDPKVGLNWHQTDIHVAGEFEQVLLP